MSVMKTTDSDISSNRRESFRIEDELALKVRVLDEESFNSIAADFDAFRLRYSIKSHMQNQRDVRKPQLIRIRKSHPDVAEYLEGLEIQFSLMAERIDQTSDLSNGCTEFTSRANLSVDGIRFVTDSSTAEGDRLELAMELSSSNTQVVMLGEVLRVEPFEDSKFSVSLLYTHIHADDTEAIVRHMARLQQLELRARRGTDE